jgi:hypothetical protein
MVISVSNVLGKRKKIIVRPRYVVDELMDFEIYTNLK